MHYIELKRNDFLHLLLVVIVCAITAVMTWGILL